MIRAAILGSPISHSLSPILHRRSYEILGISGSYEAIKVEPSRLASFLDSLDADWTGFSLTMPLKEEILKIAEVIEPLAVSINSANTLIRVGERWKALSTDVNGFSAALRAHEVIGYSSVGILGAGATARAAARAVDGRGREIFIWQRRSDHSKIREEEMRQAAPKCALHFLEWGAEIPSLDLLINTTPRGVADDLAAQIGRHVSAVLFEALYNPWPTSLLERWRERGLVAIDGLDLLVHQGIDQVALMTGQQIIRDEMAPILRAACLTALL